MGAGASIPGATPSKFTLNVAQNRFPSNFSAPMVPQASQSPPQVMNSISKCLNPDNSVNTSATIYNGRCMKCASTKQVFYAKGNTASATWSAALPNTSFNGGTVQTTPVQYMDLIGAKQACMATSMCDGITRSSDGTYVMMKGSTIPSTGKTSYTMTSAGSGARVSPADSKYYQGQLLSSQDIPRAFADDYRGTTAAAPTPPTAPNTVPETLVQSVLNLIPQSLNFGVQQQSYLNAITSPWTPYYNIEGLERTLRESAIPQSLNRGSGSGSGSGSAAIDYGICVGSCDPQHSLHDPIQMYYDSANRKYILWGTTCHDDSEKTIYKPSIAALYTPQKGMNCPPIDGATYEYINRECKQQCQSDEIDQGNSCRQASSIRKISVPRYSCPNGVSLLDNRCLADCPSGFVSRGEYCIPTPQTATAPIEATAGSGSGTIKCIQTPYMDNSKWLCDSQADLDTLLAGQQATSGSSIIPTGATYVNPNDVVCVTDDPETGMYLCDSVSNAMAKNNLDSMRTDLSTTCNKLGKAYLDLSNNLTIFSTANTNVIKTTTQITNIYGTLKNSYNAMCTGSEQNLEMCRNFSKDMDQLNNIINSGSYSASSIERNIINPIKIATASRENLLAQIQQFNCPRSSYT